MRYLILVVLVAGCAAQPAPQVQYVTRTVNECAWAPKAIYRTSYPVEVKQWMVAYETARQTNCSNSK